MATDKWNTNVEKLRCREKMRYEVFNLCRDAFVNAYVTNWNEYVTELKRKGISVEHRYSPSDPSKITGTIYIKEGKRFPSSKIDRRYTYDSLVRAFKNSERIRANIRGNTAPKYKPSNQVDKLQQKTMQSSQPSSPQEEQGFAGGGGLTWPEYRAAHMDLPVQEALRRFRALKRGQNPNTMTGGMHI